VYAHLGHAIGSVRLLPPLSFDLCPSLFARWIYVVDYFAANYMQPIFVRIFFLNIGREPENMFTNWAVALEIKSLWRSLALGALFPPLWLLLSSPAATFN